MQGIAYFVDGAPRLTWPAPRAALDENGEPTGEVTQDIAGEVARLDLAEGDYALVDEEAAADWMRDNMPAPTPEELAARRIVEIKTRLNEIDAASARAMRAILNGTETAADREALAGLESEAAGLRTELAGLGG